MFDKLKDWCDLNDLIPYTFRMKKKLERLGFMRILRMMASYSRVPLYLIESGKWADDSSCKPRVEEAIEKIKSGDIRYDYYNVGGKNIDEILSFVKRYYYSNIGKVTN